jgi:DNA invertase Pin-like site-specific DNA recombinase
LKEQPLTEEKLASANVDELREICRQLLSENQDLRALISARTRDAVNGLREQGLKFNGNLPYGLESDDLTKELKPSRYEARLISEIKQLHGAGLSLRAIALTLTEKHFVNRDGNPIDPKQVARILDAAGVVRERRSPVP